MGFLNKLFNGFSGQTGPAPSRAWRSRQFEPLEERRPLAADIWVGAVYYDDMQGEDLEPNVIEITFQGGGAGTELTELIINMDKLDNGLTIGDTFFHTAPGGPGVFGHHSMTFEAQGFDVLSVTTIDGATDFNGAQSMRFVFSGFTAGDRLIIRVDVDEMGFLGANAVAEGNEFEGSRLTATFVTPNYQDVTGTDVFLDFYDHKLAQSGLDLPPDAYAPPLNEPHPVRTAGAMFKLTPPPLPGSVSGRVHADLDGDCTFDPGEPLLAGVRIDLLDTNGNLLATTYTDAQGEYQFDNLLPGTYTVFQHQPDGYLQGGTKVGSVGGSVVATDTIGGIVIDSNVHAVNYDFCEKLPSSISGRVHADLDGDCLYDPGEPLLSGVRIDLLDAQGNLLATTYTDVNGEYKFDNLPPGEYMVFQHQPAGYFQGGNRVGSVGGAVVSQDLIGGIVLVSDTHGVNYDFCEKLPSSISGRVHADFNDDCLWQPGEPLLSGVRIDLLDAQGNLLATTYTDVNGEYKFDNLPPGEYMVFQHQPAGYFQGGNRVGSVGGAVVSQDLIGGIVLVSDTHGVNYDFCEKPPVSISGRVHADLDGDCLYDPGEPLLSGVRIDLLDPQGNLLATTYTDVNGQYKFEGLPAGEYTVFQHQPDGYFQGANRVGSHGGAVIAQDTIGGIILTHGQDAVNYDFCEKPPGRISGFVFQDGPPIGIADPNASMDDLIAQIPTLRPGVRGADDTPIAGVRLDLLDASGNLLATTYTNAAGYYVFDGLPAGWYTVVQHQPASYVDGLDTPGSTGGSVLPPPGDRIMNIRVDAGVYSHENNFSEVRFEQSPPPILQPPPETPLRLNNAPGFLEPPPVIPPPPVAAAFVAPPTFYSGGGVVGYTWHLSVVNGGRPRANRLGGEAVAQLASARQMASEAWSDYALNQTRWIFQQGTEPDAPTREIIFGANSAIPVVGDFNGDGVTDIGVYIDGQWFIDLNGNGIWDEGDLWAQLGDRYDQPVAGDWDGDGKTDIGIFGRTWPGDPRALANEPGMPAADNPLLGARKNMPPKPEHATLGLRSMQLTSTGSVRADLIDHVFRYGAAGDIAIVGDWNGDGIATIGVFRNGYWQLDMDGDGRFTDADATFQMGQPGDLPVVGDFNGDGISNLGVFRDGMWHIDMDGNRVLDARDLVFQLGGEGDLPVVGDWDGDGRADPAAFTP